MSPFAYRRAETVESAVAAVAGHPNAAFLAGGTNLVDRMKLGITTPGLLVDVRHLPLQEVVELPDGTIRIGATARNSDLAAHPLIRGRYPALSQALLAGASGQIRNVATTAGNLLQHTRCPHYQDVSLACNKREPGSGCSALGGYTRYHAVLGASSACVAVHPSDLAVALAAFDASVVVIGRDGERLIRLLDLYRLPGESPERETVLAPSDLITAVELPPLSFSARSGYRKVRDRASYAFALVSVAAALDLADGSSTVRDVRIALGGVAARPWRASLAEDFLRGADATSDNFRRAADRELAQAQPLPDNAFKITLVRNALAALLSTLAEGRPPEDGRP